MNSWILSIVARCAPILPIYTLDSSELTMKQHVHKFAMVWSRYVRRLR